MRAGAQVGAHIQMWLEVCSAGFRSTSCPHRCQNWRISQELRQKLKFEPVPLSDEQTEGWLLECGEVHLLSLACLWH